MLASLKKIYALAILFLLMVLVPQWAFAALNTLDEVGRSLFVRGAVSAQNDSGAARLLEKQKPVYQHDKILTGTKSFTIIEMNDGTRITLRPDTIFVIDEYVWKEGDGKASYSLLKGGMRALTGLIGKTNPDANTVTTPYATMGIRGTEYDARLCEKDCAEEMQKQAEDKKIMPDSLVIGRIAMIKGVVNGKDMSGKVRQLGKGGPVYLGDILSTTDKSFVVVIFRDDSRLTLRPSSEVVLKDYLLSQKGSDENKYITELLKGGLRTLTGNIGKKNPQGFKVETASATMGIRGTGFDVFYKNPTWVHVWKGAVDFETRDGRLLVGRCGEKSGASTSCKIALHEVKRPPRYLVDLPDFMDWPLETRPDNKQFDGLYLKMFDVRDHDYSTPGLYVTTYDGHIRVKEIDIGANEALYSNGEVTYRLKKIPPFQFNDPYPKPSEIDERLLDLLGLFGTSGGREQCEVQ